MQVDSLIEDIVGRLKRTKGIKAVVLGGSYATESQRPDSDIDFGIYYQGGLDISQIRTIAIEINDFPNPVVTNLGEWGRWVNGGAWLTVNAQRVDLLYRDMDFVSQTIEDSIQGRRQSDYYQQPAYGFYSYMYCAETKICKILYDSDGSIEAFKAKVAMYPEPLKHSIVQGFMWEAQFSLDHCKKSAERGEVFITAGCLTRIANDLVQTVYALNDTYFLSEKRFYREEQTFAIKPRDLAARLADILGGIGQTRDQLLSTVSLLDGLFYELKTLCGDLYKPRFS
jgi:hypothetical protein